MNSQKEDGSNTFRISILPIILTIIFITCLSGIIFYSCLQKHVTIVDGEKVIKVVTFKNTVKGVLEQNKIWLADKDNIVPSLDTKIQNGMSIVIERAIPIVLKIGEKEQKIFTNKKTVQEVLDEQKIILNEKDKLNVDPASKVFKNLVLQITKITEDIVVEKEEIAYKVCERQTTKISRGARRVVQEGKNGLKEVTYRVIYENGNIIDKQQIKQRILLRPVNSIVEVGVEPRTVVSRGQQFRYSRELIMLATAYTPGFESTRKRPGDPGYGVTAIGVAAQRGVVAVDPRVIPLGSKLLIESMDGYPSYGYAVAADTGSAIKGNRIDLCFETVSEALRFGRRTVKVYILE